MKLALDSVKHRETTAIEREQMRLSGQIHHWYTHTKTCITIIIIIIINDTIIVLLQYYTTHIMFYINI